ncbi:hypothetical protein D3C86_2095250 [compost metagenome]
MQAPTSSSESSPPMMPIRIPMVMNSAAICSMYQSNFTTPTTMPSSEAAKIHSTTLCLSVMPAKSLRSSWLSLRFSRSSR